MPIPILFLITFILRASNLSPWLADWDSVQFALAIKDFNMVNHLPHPPGYPVYIFLARLINYFTNNPTLSLTLLSAFAGSLSIIFFYLIAKKFLSPTNAFLSSLILSFTPVHWLLSEVALSNIPGLAISLLSIYLLFLSRQKPYFLPVTSFLTGLTLGIRFDEFTILLILLLYINYSLKFKHLIRSAFYSTLGCLLWLTPLIIDTDLSEFLKTYLSQSNYILFHDSVTNAGLLSHLSFVKINFARATTLPLALLLIFSLFPFLKKLSYKNFKNSFLFLWFISFALPVVFIYNPELPRTYLPLIPPFLILAALSISRLSKKFYTLASTILIVYLFSVSHPLVHAQKTTISPSILPVLFVTETFSPDETTLLTSFTYRHFQFYAPEFQNYWTAKHFPSQFNSLYLITDYQKTADENHLLNTYTYLNTIEFRGPPEVFPRLPQTNLYIYQKTNEE